MQPNDQRHHAPYIPPRDDTPRVPDRNTQTSQEAAANIVRGQIDTILSHHDPVGDGGQTQPAQQQPVQQPAQTQTQAQNPAPQAPQSQSTQTPAAMASNEQPAPNPYRHTHTTEGSIDKQSSAQWQKYHSAWQRYYQEYYSRYYVGELYKTQADLAARQSRIAEQARQADTEPTRTNDGTMTQLEAIGDLRDRLRKQITDGAKKARGSKHFIPITSAIVVMLIFVFLQFNSIIFAAVYAYKSPGNIDPANVLTNPSVNLTVSKDPVLIVPKLNIDVPVDYNTTPDYDSQMAAMKKGVSYFGIPGADAKPGQVGNFAIAGHSSNQLFDNGKHKFIFVNLGLLKKGDLIYLNYKGKRYTYTVTHKKIVAPDDVAALQDHTKKPEVTLITCTPSGTALHRLLVFAEQISPSPSSAKKAPKSTGDSDQNITMPGNGSTLLEKIFGG